MVSRVGSLPYFVISVKNEKGQNYDNRPYGLQSEYEYFIGWR